MKLETNLYMMQFILLKNRYETKHIVRLGGDEFLVILKNTDKLEAEIFEEQIKRASTNYNANTEKIFALSFSTGSVQYEKNISIGSLLELADKKMYEKKAKLIKTSLDIYIQVTFLTLYESVFINMSPTFSNYLRAANKDANESSKLVQLQPHPYQ